jgi:uncharacterized membrane protein
MKKFFTVKVITTNALICALYVVLTIVSGPLAFNGGALQIRVSELLNLLVFFNPIYTVGLTLGCLLSNIISMYGWPDLVLGTGATLLGCLAIILISKTIKSLLISSLMPVIFNASIVPIVVYLYDTSIPLNSFYWVSFCWVGLGEIIVCVIIGYPLILTLAKKYKGFYDIISATNRYDLKW